MHSFGCHGNDTGEFEFPWDIAVDSEGNILVVEEMGRIQVFQADGACIHAFGGKGEEPGKFVCPWAIGVGPTGQVAVSDRNLHNVQVF